MRRSSGRRCQPGRGGRRGNRRRDPRRAGKITANSIARSIAVVTKGCRWDAGAVSTPTGYREAYQLYAEGGWVGVGGDPAFGGMGMPKVISAQVEEMMNSASGVRSVSDADVWRLLVDLRPCQRRA